MPVVKHDNVVTIILRLVDRRRKSRICRCWGGWVTGTTIVVSLKMLAVNGDEGGKVPFESILMLENPGRGLC